MARYCLRTVAVAAWWLAVVIGVNAFHQPYAISAVLMLAAAVMVFGGGVGLWKGGAK
jgi:hypothetical protein